LKKSDAQLFFRWRNQINHIKNTRSIRLPKHEELEETWVSEVMLDKNDRSLILMIEVSGEAVGFIQLNLIDWISKNCYFGIAICEDGYSGKGYGKIASKLLFDYAFGNLNIHKISVEVASFNENSIAHFENFGFSQEGTLKEQYYWDNEYHDVHLYGLLKANYQ
jgi:RimJ/RimL family protein N-acetyltransferase